MTEEKVALITGITGQDGSYLAELLLAKGYSVSIYRRNDHATFVDYFNEKDKVILAIDHFALIIESNLSRNIFHLALL